MRAMLSKILVTAGVALLLLVARSGLAEIDPWAESYRLERLYQYDSALRALDVAEKTDSDNELIFLRRGWLHYLSGNHSKSINYYKKAVRKNTKSLEARLGMILPLLAQQRWREAMLEAQRVLEVAPWNYQAHVHLMTCEHALKQWTVLAKHAQEVAARYPSDVSVLVYLARAHHHMDDSAGALSAYQRVLNISPEHVEAGQYLAQPAR